MMPAPVAFLPRPREAQRCACGELLTMEMERDSGQCTDCMATAAILREGSFRVPAHLLREVGA